MGKAMKEASETVINTPDTGQRETSMPIFVTYWHIRVFVRFCHQLVVSQGLHNCSRVGLFFSYQEV